MSTKIAPSQTTTFIFEVTSTRSFSPFELHDKVSQRLFRTLTSIVHSHHINTRFGLKPWPLLHTCYSAYLPRSFTLRSLVEPPLTLYSIPFHSIPLHFTLAAMATTPSLTSPLDERANGYSSGDILSPKPIYPQVLYEQKIRRTNSLRRIIVKSDTDSLPSPDEDAIYNASPVESVEELHETKTPLQDYQSFDTPPTAPNNSPEPTVPTQSQLASIPRSISLPLSPKSPPLGNSQWPAPHLGTIVEHRGSMRSLRHTISAPRLRSSPERSPRFVKIQDSIHSIRPVRSYNQAWPTPNQLPGNSGQHQRSFSLNDLDCLQKLVKIDKASACTSVSCTSSEALQAVPGGPSYPVKPVDPPPARVPTPPGLPSFGTREAQVIRLIPDRERRQRPRLFPSWLVHSHDEGDHRVSDIANAAAVANTAPENQLSSPSEGLLKRLLAASGMARVVSPPVQNRNEQPRASLPAGIVATAETRILALAADGTAVRGKFGIRSSGHGIGQRDLSNHPLTRADRSSVIDEEVRQIEKVCAEMNRGSNSNQIQSLPDVPYASIDAELHRRLADAERRGSALHQGSNSHHEFLSPVSSRFALPPPASPYHHLPPLPVAQLSIQPSPIPPANSPMNLCTTLVDGMREPADYAARARDPIAGSRTYITQGERIRAEGRFDIEHDKELSKCRKGVAIFCLDNCGNDTLNKKSVYRIDPQWTHREDFVSRGDPQESLLIRQQAYRENQTRLPQSRRTTRSAARTADDANQAAIPAAAGAACATSIVCPVACAQMDGQSNPIVTPRMEEPVSYPPQLDGQACSRVEGPRPEWRPQDSKYHWWDCCCYPRRPDPQYDGPPSPRTQAVLDRRAGDRARGANPYKAEQVRMHRRFWNDIHDDPEIEGCRQFWFSFCLCCCDYSKREHKSVNRAMAPEFLVTRPQIVGHMYGTAEVYPKEWMPRSEFHPAGRPVFQLDEISGSRPVETGVEKQPPSSTRPPQLDGPSDAGLAEETRMRSPPQLDGQSASKQDSLEMHPPPSPMTQAALDRKAADEAAGKNPYNAEAKRLRRKWGKDVHDDQEMTKAKKFFHLINITPFGYSKKEHVSVERAMAPEILETMPSSGGAGGAAGAACGAGAGCGAGGGC